LRAAGVSFEGKRHYDVMKEFARLHGARNEFGRRGYVKLERCAAHYGYTIKGAHDAEADAKATLYCYHQLLRDINYAR
jgi:DNA polymerase III epsilon subunit-like protein